MMENLTMDVDGTFFTTHDIVYNVDLNAFDKILFHNKICRFIRIVLVAI